MAKAKKEYILQDKLNVQVNPGDEVILLVKVRGYCRLDNAYLGHCIYVGHCQYGYQFIDISRRQKYEENPSQYINDYNKTLNLRDPECIKLDNGRVVGFFKK